MYSINKIINKLLLKYDIYEYIQIQNCSDYSFCINTFNDWLIDIDTYPNNLDTDYYFIVDTAYDTAFGHWIYETFIHINLFHILKSKYSNIKLVLKNKRMFKQVFLDFVNIYDNDIIYNITNSNNISFFPMPTSLNYTGNNELHYKLIDNLFSYFNNIKLSNDIYFKYIIMPRQIKENYQSNDVYISYELLKQHFIEHYNNNYTILNTDNIDKLIDQINIVSNSDNIIITDGSPFLVNGLFCKNKNIHLCGRLCTHLQANVFPAMKKIRDNIMNNNNVISYINEMDFISKNIQSFK
jgi:hypothetical protein